jgi:DUF1680 family protein
VLAAPQAARGLALRVPAWSASTRVSANNDPERTGISPGYHVLHRPWRPGDVISAPGMAVTRGTPVTAIAIPYFQWDNRDGRAMRVWMPR